MSGKKASTSTAEASADSDQTNTKRRSGKRTRSKTPTRVVRSSTTSAPDVREPPDSLGDVRTLRSIRKINSLPEGLKDARLSKKETVLDERTALTTRSGLRVKSNDPRMLALGGSKTTDRGDKLSRDSSIATSFRNASASRSGPSETLVPPNRPHRLGGVHPSASLQSTVDEESLGGIEPRYSQTSLKVMQNVEVMPGPSGGPPVPSFCLTESSPVKGRRRPVTRYVLTPESFIEEGLGSATSVGAAPFVDVISLPEHRLMGSSATAEGPQDPSRLQVPHLRSRARRNPDEIDTMSMENIQRRRKREVYRSVDSLESVEVPVLCDDAVGTCLVRPCPSMIPYWRPCFWGCLFCVILVLSVCVFAFILYEGWKRSHKRHFVG